MMRGRPLGHDETRPQEPDPVRLLAAAVLLQAIRDARKGWDGEQFTSIGTGAMLWLQVGGSALLNAFGADIDDVMRYATAPKNPNKATYRRAHTQEEPA